MIEVEKKFALTEANHKKLTEGAKFVVAKLFTDEYYDDANYSLGRKDCWLRTRDGAWELKTPLNDKPKGERVSDQYREINEESKIKEFLGFDPFKPLGESLKENGYIPFAKIATTRKKYKWGEFIIDIDMTDFGYEIAEIELMVENESEMENATQKILEFAHAIGLTKELIVRGKISEYLHKFKPEAHKILLDAGVLSA